IARYRKEATGGLDEVQIRQIEERRAYLIELDNRRKTILSSISEQGKLSPEIEKKINACATKSELEDLYLPFKPKRRTRGMIARERGLEPLAKRIQEQPVSGDPLAEAAAFVRSEGEVPDAEAALAGARDIVAERLAERADIRAMVRETYTSDGVVRSKAALGKENTTSKFEQYYAFEEPVKSIPSHRFLAIRRGESESFLRVRIWIDPEQIAPRIESMANINRRSPFATHMAKAALDSLKRLVGPSLETEIRVELKMRADREAVEVFARNLRTLLLSAPLGGKSVIGIDPGIRTGCKCVAVDATGKYLDNMTFMPPFARKSAGGGSRAEQDLLAFLRKYPPQAIAVGNGTAGRETEKFVRATIKAAKPGEFKDVVVVAVNEAGASVYSASTIARSEFPNLDVTIRGSISIARRLQDPLAELVKIEPKAIGVGQYQHDVFQRLLERKLDQVVESCVNHVGVDLNTASAPLLARVSGIGPRVAQSIVDHREAQGAFDSRKTLLKVAGVGPRTYEQAAGFLRVLGGHPLDGSAVHPERYELVAKFASDIGVELAALVGNQQLASRIEVSRYVTQEVGEPTLLDIVEELKKPGRDPREQFDPPKFREDVTSVSDLKEGMWLEGVVTNVTAFGAFVDIGVHRDGLVHISQLADSFVRDPHAVVKAGDRLQVHVLEVDHERGRIALSARKKMSSGAGKGARPQSEKPAAPSRNSSGGSRGRGQRDSGKRSPKRESFANNPFARLLKS
ncbi:MAG: Tex family protein, partial [Nannocystaceae bacterium]